MLDEIHELQTEHQRANDPRSVGSNAGDSPNVVRQKMSPDISNCITKNFRSDLQQMQMLSTDDREVRHMRGIFLSGQLHWNECVSGTGQCGTKCGAAQLIKHREYRTICAPCQGIFARMLADMLHDKFWISPRSTSRSSAG